MRIICPCCHTDFPLEAGINDVAARNAVKLAFSITPLGDSLLAYVQLFKPEKKVLSMSKLTKLLEELVPMMRDGKIEYKGRVWPAPQPYWEQSIRQMLDSRESLTLPIKTHGYLFSIIAGYADKDGGKTEKQTEARRASGASRRQEPQPKAAKMPQEVKDQLDQFLNKKVS